MALLSGTCCGPYEIVERIGVGGMGEVYRARDVRLGRDVAIKVLTHAFGEDRERLRRFEQEARILAALSHPNILAIYDVGSHQDVPYLVMELLEGETLRERLSRGALPVLPAVELALQMARGLAAAHAKGLIHRDLKPANLFITHEGDLKILDFGLAKWGTAPPEERTADEETQSFSSEGLVLGTAGYMSPEQVTGRPVDARSDLFAFGAVLYEMVSGHRAFGRANAMETLDATLRADPPELESPAGPVPEALKRLVARCLEKEPSRRIESALHLALALQVALEDGVDVKRTRFRLHARWDRTWRNRRFWPSVAALVAILGVAVTLARQSLQREPSRPPSLVALPAKVLGSPESAFLTDAIPDTLSTLLAGVEGIDTKCPPSSVDMEKMGGDTSRVAQAYRADLLLFTTVTVQGDHLVLNAQLVEAPTRKVRWASQFEGTRGGYNDLIRQAAVGLVWAMRPPGARASVIPGPAFSSEIELALREGRHLARRFMSTRKEGDFVQALAALQRAQSLDPTSAPLAAELGMLFTKNHYLMKDPQSHQQAKAWATRALELDPRCGLAWTVCCLNEVYAVDRADPDKLAEYALKAVALSPGDPRGHIALGSMAPTMAIQAATGLHVMDLDPLDAQGYGWAAMGLMDTNRAAEAVPILERALRLDLSEDSFCSNKFWLFRALFKLDRREEALKTFAPGWGSEMIRDLLNQDLAAAREEGLKQVASWREDAATTTAQGWANRAYFFGPLLVRVGLKEEALWVLQKAAESGGPMNLDLPILDPDLRQLKGDPRYHRALKVFRENARCFLRHAEAAEAQGDLPPYLKPSVAELRELLKRSL